MRIVVLGSAAGGGLPQWNCNCGNCRLARKRAATIKPRTQSSIAVSRDGGEWFLFNCSPDLRQQINANPCLWPRDALRDSPIAGVVLTNGDVDHLGGLVNLRERQPLIVHATRPILDTLASNRIMSVLSADVVGTRELHIGVESELMTPRGPARINVEAFTVPGKTALYLEDNAPALDAESAETVGLKVEADGATFFYVPACARVTPELQRRIDGAPLVFWDGTLWKDDEMIELGVGEKTGRRMGHMSIGGADGSLRALEDTRLGRRVFIHLNNTNPVLREDSVEHAAVRAAGWEVAYDGMEIRL